MHIPYGTTRADPGFYKRWGTENNTGDNMPKSEKMGGTGSCTGRRPVVATPKFEIYMYIYVEYNFIWMCSQAHVSVNIYTCNYI
jgi:hypothetical protein